MPYRFKAGESVPENIRRIVQEEIKSGTDQLTKTRGQRDEAIHEARKTVKKIRGVLRLVRSELGQTYKEENQLFREVGRQLSEIRDAAALIEVFDALAVKYKDSLQQSALRGVRAGLVLAKQEGGKAANVQKARQSADQAFRAAAKRIDSWPLKKEGFSAIAPGLKLSYEAGKKALKQVQKDPTSENYHYFRRRAKDHWYQVRLLESLWTEVQTAHENSLKKLEQWLGDDHNLVVLREKLHGEPDKFGGEEQVRLFLSLADQYQKELRETAVSMGQRVYAQKPKQFITDIAKLWETWREQPESMKQQQREERQAIRKPPQTAQRKKGKTAAA